MSILETLRDALEPCVNEPQFTELIEPTLGPLIYPTSAANEDEREKRKKASAAWTDLHAKTSQEVRYKAGGKDSPGYGRFYATTRASAQSVERGARAILYGPKNLCIDGNQAALTIAIAVGKACGVEPPDDASEIRTQLEQCIEEYVRGGLAKDLAKESVNALIFGANPMSDGKFAGIYKDCDERTLASVRIEAGPFYAWLKKLRSEIDKRVPTPFRAMVQARDKGKAPATSSAHPQTSLSTLCLAIHSVERVCMTHVRDLLSKEGRTVTALIHDAVLVAKHNAEETEVPGELLRKIDAHVFERTGIPLTFKDEAMVVPNSQPQYTGTRNLSFKSYPVEGVQQKLLGMDLFPGTQEADMRITVPYPSPKFPKWEEMKVFVENAGLIGTNEPCEHGVPGSLCLMANKVICGGCPDPSCVFCKDRLQLFDMLTRDGSPLTSDQQMKIQLWAQTAMMNRIIINMQNNIQNNYYGGDGPHVECGDWEHIPKDHLDYFHENYAFILRRQTYINVKNFIEYKLEAFISRHKKKQTQIPGRKFPVPSAKLFAETPDTSENCIAEYEDTCCQPFGPKSIPPSAQQRARGIFHSYLNTWTDPGTDGAVSNPDGDCSLFYKLTEILFPDEDVANWMLDLFARKAQYPNEKIPAFIQIIGFQAAGKSQWINLILEALYGPIDNDPPHWAVADVQKSNLNFNSLTTGKQVVVFEEVYAEQNKRGLDQDLKQLITSNHTNQTFKYSETKTIRDHTLFIATRNPNTSGKEGVTKWEDATVDRDYDVCVRPTDPDDRRHLFVWVGRGLKREGLFDGMTQENGEPMDCSAWMSALVMQMRTGGFGKLRHDLKKREVSDFEVRDLRPSKVPKQLREWKTAVLGGQKAERDVLKERDAFYDAVVAASWTVDELKKRDPTIINQGRVNNTSVVYTIAPWSRAEKDYGVYMWSWEQILHEFKSQSPGLFGAYNAPMVMNELRNRLDLIRCRRNVTIGTTDDGKRKQRWVDGIAGLFRRAPDAVGAGVASGSEAGAGKRAREDDEDVGVGPSKVARE